MDFHFDAAPRASLKYFGFLAVGAGGAQHCCSAICVRGAHSELGSGRSAQVQDSGEAFRAASLDVTAPAAIPLYGACITLDFHEFSNH